MPERVAIIRRAIARRHASDSAVSRPYRVRETADFIASQRRAPEKKASKIRNFTLITAFFQ